MTLSSVRRRHWRATVLIALTLVILTAVNVGVGSASDQVHPAHVHVGSCPAPGEVMYPLSDVGAGVAIATPDTLPPSSQSVAIPVATSVTTIDTDLQSIIDGNHAIVVHESADAMQNYIVCGNLGDAVNGSDLSVGLAEVNDSGHVGIAALHDNGDGTTTVSLYIATFHGLRGESGLCTNSTSATCSIGAEGTPAP